MKVLFLSRRTLFSVPGGDTVQLSKTAEYLRRLGVSVDVSTELEPSFRGYDLVHVFNLMRPQEVFLQVRKAKNEGRPVALSTIYGLYTEYERKARKGFAGVVARRISPWEMERLKVIARAVVSKELTKGSLLVARDGYRHLCERITDMVDVFLPNSRSEMLRVQHDFPPSVGKPYVVVPNAVDLAVFNPDRVQVPKRVESFRDCVLSVARIEGRKCQLELVRALRDSPFRLVLIGKPAPNHLAYFEQVKREAGDQVHFVGQVNHDELACYYSVARVHALISWMETPGLSSLEAGAMGCRLVVTEKGDTRDYFADDAWYCNPESIASIKAAVEAAYGAPPVQRLAERIRREFTWEKAAEKTLEGYGRAMAGSVRP